MLNVINPPMRKFLCLEIIIIVLSSVSNYFISESPTQGYFLVQKSRILLWKHGPLLPALPPIQAMIMGFAHCKLCLKRDASE